MLQRHPSQKRSPGSGSGNKDKRKNPEGSEEDRRQKEEEVKEGEREWQNSRKKLFVRREEIVRMS